jgi:flagellar biosynthesis GTPase FlhF
LEALTLLLQMAGGNAKVLQLQSEAVDRGKSFEATTGQRALNGRLTARRAEHEAELARLAAEATRAREIREREAARAAEALWKLQEQQRRELARKEREKELAAEAHRARMDELRPEQERAEKREKDLQREMERLKIQSTRKEKKAAFSRRVADQSYHLGSTVRAGMLRPRVQAYALTCDNCFETISAATYYRKGLPLPAIRTPKRIVLIIGPRMPNLQRRRI